MKKYFIISSTLSVIGFIAGIIIFVYIDIPRASNLIEEILNFNFTIPTQHNSNLVFLPSGDGESYTYEETYTLSRGSLDIDLNVANVEIIETTAADLKLTITSSAPENFSVYATKNNLEIVEENPICIGFCFDSDTNSTVTLEVPVDYNLQNIDLNTNIGSVDMKNVALTNLDIESVMGNVEVSNTDTANINVEHVNGNITLSDLTFNSLDVETINSSISFTNLDGISLDTNIVNGSMNFKNIYVPSIEIDKVNGQLTLINDDKTFEIKQLKTSPLRNDDLIDANVKSYK